MRSAADMLEVGCPDPALLLARMPLMRICRAPSCSVSRSTGAPTRPVAAMLDPPDRAPVACSWGPRLLALPFHVTAPIMNAAAFAPPDRVGAVPGAGAPRC